MEGTIELFENIIPDIIMFDNRALFHLHLKATGEPKKISTMVACIIGMYGMEKKDRCVQAQWKIHG